jgi:mannose-6-phosphate isomerase-like protein (cupin superfamily)
MGGEGGLRLVRHHDLAMRWNTVGAGPGTLRYFVQYVGGPEPHPHGSRGIGVESDKGACGLHRLPAGNLMPEHTHPAIDEVYVVIRGQMAVASGAHEVLAGPLDCVHIPAGTPHTSRNAGTEDVQFLWFQWGFDAPAGGAAARPIPGRASRPAVPQRASGSRAARRTVRRPAPRAGRRAAHAGRRRRK